MLLSRCEEPTKADSQQGQPGPFSKSTPPHFPSNSTSCTEARRQGCASQQQPPARPSVPSFPRSSLRARRTGGTADAGGSAHVPKTPGSTWEQAGPAAPGCSPPLSSSQPIALLSPSDTKTTRPKAPRLEAGVGRVPRKPGRGGRAAMARVCLGSHTGCQAITSLQAGR